MEKPVACTLSSTDHETRVARWRELARRAGREVSQTPNGVRLSFGAEAESELRELAALERECCAFADWSVAVEGDTAVLDVTADGDAIPATQMLFASLS